MIVKPPLLNRAEAARRLGVSTKTLDRLRFRGRLGYIQIGDRVLLAEQHIEAFLRGSHRHRPEPVA